MPRSTRKLKRGGARGETMRFLYTNNPLRRGWTETIYPLAQFFLQIPSQIPWDEYEYVGPTTVDIIHTNERPVNIESVVKAALANTVDTGGVPNKLATVENRYRDMFHYKELSVRARCHRVPYELFGGSVCELYNRHIQGNRLGINLHETTDPTGDMDIFMKDLDIELTHPEEIEPAERSSIKTIIVENVLTHTLSPLYDHYTQWILNHILRLLEPLVRQTTGPLFFPKEQEGNAELYYADILESVGNFLVTRAITNNMLKIQCGIGVNTEEGPVQDHIFEFVFSTRDLRINEDTQHTDPPEMAATYSLPVSFGSQHFHLFVQDPVSLLNGQAKGFVDRIPLRNRPEYIHKLYNHYGRILFCLQLLIWAHIEGIPPSHYRTEFFPYLNTILDDKLLDLVPSPCYEPCKKNMIQEVYRIVLGM